MYAPDCCVSLRGHTRNLHSFPTRRSSDLKSPGRSRRKTRARSEWPPSHRDSRKTVSGNPRAGTSPARGLPDTVFRRSEEHTSELLSQSNLVCRLLLEKKKVTPIQLTRVLT